MPHRDWLVLIGLGGLFILLGICSIIWGRSEERTYYDSLSTRRDVREFLEHLPGRPEPWALKLGGRIAIIIGLAMLIAVFILWLGGNVS